MLWDEGAMMTRRMKMEYLTLILSFVFPLAQISRQFWHPRKRVSMFGWHKYCSEIRRVDWTRAGTAIECCLFKRKHPLTLARLNPNRGTANLIYSRSEKVVTVDFLVNNEWKRSNNYPLPVAHQHRAHTFGSIPEARALTGAWSKKTALREPVAHWVLHYSRRVHNCTLCCNLRAFFGLSTTTAMEQVSKSPLKVPRSYRANVPTV